ncbi:30S ribosome-binding factor RbfA [Parashewanella spongiae]|uniref:Ribosome-binding factor A n=1 Tax=Parashewanella spongiae TaxID=342950 RepID=A0A3A6TG67_9GAMM|nr:30S ribosome-binding factor RbfA [Parashewanella spongiae]MCL1079037.1 30S ribosome-binding factor RbfA [Parashewanella spongiae]RJY10809.1 30S ribosome-binding factor RbfA [Parashewanella spongiae]
MAKEFSRTRRIGQQLQQELAMVIQREIKDPRVGMVTVNEVEVSRDLSFARVFVTFFDEDESQVESKLEALSGASGYIRTLIAGRMKLRIMPQLKFVYDSSLVEGMRMSNLVTKIVSEDEAKSTASSDKCLDAESNSSEEQS